MEATKSASKDMMFTQDDDRYLNEHDHRSRRRREKMDFNIHKTQNTDAM